MLGNKRVLQMVKPSAAITNFIDKDTHHCLLVLSLAVAIVIHEKKGISLECD